MGSILLAHHRARIPFGLDNLEAFRRWARSDECPPSGRFAFLAGDLYVDFSRPELFSHGQAKLACLTALTRLIDSADRGYLFTDPVLLSHVLADLSVQPDLQFVSYDAFREGRMRTTEGPGGDAVELVGTPDMVLEVVSASSVQKDTVTLRELYAAAEVPEYWLIDAREDPPRFDILRLSDKGYTPARRQSGGWLRSPVFGRSFRFIQQTDALGHPLYTLEVRP